MKIENNWPNSFEVINFEVTVHTRTYIHRGWFKIYKQMPGIRFELTTISLHAHIHNTVAGFKRKVMPGSRFELTTPSTSV